MPFKLFLENLAEHYKNLLLIKLGKFKNLNSFLHPDELEKYQQSATYYTQDQCFTILDYLTHQMENCKKPFKRINLEIILLHIIRSMTKISIEALTKELIELKDTICMNPIELLTDLKTVLPVKEFIEPTSLLKNEEDPPTEFPETKSKPTFSLQKKLNMIKSCILQVLNWVEPLKNIKDQSISVSSVLSVVIKYLLPLEVKIDFYQKKR